MRSGTGFEDQGELPPELQLRVEVRCVIFTCNRGGRTGRIRSQ